MKIVNRICPYKIRMELYRKVHPEQYCDYKILNGFMTANVGKRVRKMILERFKSTECRFIYVDQMNPTPSSRRPYISGNNINIAIVLEF